MTAKKAVADKASGSAAKAKAPIKRSLLPVLAMVAVAGLLAFGVMFAVARNNSSSASAPIDCNGACVALMGKAADPNVLTVETGSYVQFNCADGKKHNLALAHAGVQHEDHSEYESGEFGGDEAWRVQFKKDGSYAFRDSLNPDMSVTVVAFTPGKDYKVE